MVVMGLAVIQVVGILTVVVVVKEVCDDGGVGDGVGVWTVVEGLAGVCCELWSEEIPTSEGVVGRSSWASVSIGSVIDFDVPITSPCWSRVNVIVTVSYGFLLA